MAFDEYIVERISRVLESKKVSFRIMKMMGGMCFMVDEKMCVGVMGKKDGRPNQIMARIGPAVYEAALLREGCSEMTFTGRSMKGFVFVVEDAFDTEDDLEYWVQLCIDYNPLAKASKKRKKKK